jgi:hypothetical protein
VTRNRFTGWIRTATTTTTAQKITNAGALLCEEKAAGTPQTDGEGSSMTDEPTHEEAVANVINILGIEQVISDETV